MCQNDVYCIHNDILQVLVLTAFFFMKSNTKGQKINDSYGGNNE